MATADTMAAMAAAAGPGAIAAGAGLGMPWDEAYANDALLRVLGAGVGPSTFPALPPPPTSHLHAAGPDSALAAAAEGRARVRAAALTWERERDAADALARQIAEAEQLLVLPASPDVGATSSGSTGHACPTPRSSSTIRPIRTWRNSTTRPGVSKTSASFRSSSSLSHLLRPLAGHGPHPPPLRPRRPHPRRRLGRGPDPLMAAPRQHVLSWILGTISLDLHDLVRNSADAHRAWLALEGQFMGNAEARALRLDASFPTFVQGDTSVGEFCCRMKGMVNSLGDLGWPVEDRLLVLNVLRGLSDRYAHLRTWITRQRRFPTFQQVRDDLVMEELTQGLQLGSNSAPGSSPSSTALDATPPPRPSAAPPSSLLGPPPGPSGGGRGPWRPLSPRRGTWCGSWLWEQPGAGTSTGCTLALFPQPWLGRISMWRC